MSFPLFDEQKEDVIKKLGKKPDAGVPIDKESINFKVSSWLLMDFHAEVCANRGVEIMEHVCGLDFSDFLTWERLNRFNLSVQNALFVKGEASSNLTSLIHIENHGYILTGWVHNHTGNGEGSVHPSGTDIKNQKALEVGNYAAVGAIFSQDGFIRFFSDRLKFNVEILGKGVQKVGENLYRIAKT
jgi:hypothetical protein